MAITITIPPFFLGAVGCVMAIGLTADGVWDESSEPAWNAGSVRGFGSGEAGASGELAGFCAESQVLLAGASEVSAGLTSVAVDGESVGLLFLVLSMITGYPPL